MKKLWLLLVSSSAYGSVAQDNCTTGDVRLPGGVGDEEGRVEVCYNHVWGSVCLLGFTPDHANLVCNQLGHQPFGTYSNTIYTQ